MLAGNRGRFAPLAVLAVFAFVASACAALPDQLDAQGPTAEGWHARGDLNCDGATDTYDIDPFKLALMHASEYAATFPECDILLADCNFDGDIDTYDIDVFVEIIVAGGLPEGMVLIPASEFEMGDPFNEGSTNERPVHTVNIDAFYIDATEVSKTKWDAVRSWAISNGYDLIDAPAKGADHPVHSVNWYDAVKFCNARSEQEGRTPCYYQDAGLSTVYRSGELTPHVNWNANGYRLPTEAEWEKAARGGLTGQHFPWGNTIQHAQANYYSTTHYWYDTSPTRGHHPDYDDGGYPYTCPVDAFSPNGYGCYNMAGNVWEWCHDWYGADYYYNSPTSNPTGLGSGSRRVLRGGGWGDSANYCRAANRTTSAPAYRDTYFGFRCVAGTW